MSKTTPWRYHGKTIGYDRGGTFYIRRTINGKSVRISTGCVTLEAANKEFQRFEVDPERFVSRLGRSPFSRSDPRALQRRANLLTFRYRITAERYDALLEQQGSKCAICGSVSVIGKRRTLEVDHDHTTGTVRGLLCGSCNKAIGLLADSAILARAAAVYLETRAPETHRIDQELKGAGT